MDKPYGLTMRGIVKNKDNEILILRRHPKSRTNPHKWELPGGKVDPGEFFDEALVREIKEETNLDGAVGGFYEAIQDDYVHKRTVQVIMYLKNITGNVAISDEHDDWMWANLEKIKTLVIYSVDVDKKIAANDEEIKNRYTILSNAIINKKNVTLIYHKKNRIFLPYTFSFYKNLIYTTGFSYTDNDIRTFNLAEIKDLKKF